MDGSITASCPRRGLDSFGFDDIVQYRSTFKPGQYIFEFDVLNSVSTFHRNQIKFTGTHKLDGLTQASAVEDGPQDYKFQFVLLCVNGRCCIFPTNRNTGQFEMPT